MICLIYYSGGREAIVDFIPGQGKNALNAMTEVIVSLTI
jgi:hypothetical protein